MIWFLIGLALGQMVAFIIATYLGNIAHEEWCSLCDRQQALIEKLYSKLKHDPADWWKDN